MANRILTDNLLIVSIILAVILGVSLGLGLKNDWRYDDYESIWYLEFPGRVVLNMLKMLILPLVVSSLITGMATIESHATGKLGAAAMAYYFITTLCAVITGITMVLIIHPGSHDDLSRLKRQGSSTDTKPIDALFDLMSQGFPDNLVSACFERVTTDIKMVESEPRLNRTDNTSYTVMLRKPGLKTTRGTNVLGVVVFCIALGVVINHLGEQGQPLKDFFLSFNSAIMVLVGLVIWCTPIGIMFLIAGKFVATKDIGDVLTGLGKYMGTVIGGLVVHGFVVLPAIYIFTTGKNPFPFCFNMSKALFTAWGTASSSATLPITMDCLVKNNNIDINIVRFVAPVGATINMDGTALYEAVACIFIAQVNGMSLSIADVIIISLTATAAAVGAAGVPQAGLVTLVMVLTAVRLPTEDVTLILAIDWLLDRFRTAINVWGDSVGAGILDHYFKTRLSKVSSSDIPLQVNQEEMENKKEDPKPTTVEIKNKEIPSSTMPSDVNPRGSAIDPSFSSTSYTTETTK